MADVALPWREMVTLAGIGQILLAAVSLVIPRVLGWRLETTRLRPLTRQVFWTWAGYVWASHIAFGLLSAFGAGLLLEGTPLARCVAAFIGAWWGVRLVIQFTYFDRSARPPGARYVLAEIGLVALFVANTALYIAVALRPAP